MNGNEFIAKQQDRVTGALIGMARSARGRRTETTDRLLLKGLSMGGTGGSLCEPEVQELLDRIHAETARLGSAVQDYNMERLWEAPEEICSLKTLLLYGIRGMAVYVRHGAAEYRNEEAQSFFYRVLLALGNDSVERTDLLPMVLEAGKINRLCRKCG